MAILGIKETRAILSRCLAVSSYCGAYWCCSEVGDMSLKHEVGGVQGGYRVGPVRCCSGRCGCIDDLPSELLRQLQI